MIHTAHRFDVKGRKYIGTLLKYYFEDVRLRNARIGFRQKRIRNEWRNNRRYYRSCKKYAETFFKTDTSGHDFFHTVRVCRIASYIAKEEHADPYTV